jgi:dihydrofolate reductase
MRKVKYFVANSLDNFIARRDGGVDWLFMDGDYGMKEFFASVDAVLIGRKTYEFALAHSPKPKRKKAAGKPKTKSVSKSAMKSYLFSRTFDPALCDDVELVSEHAGQFVRELKSQQGKDIWLMGGGELARSLFAENLVDEISLAIHPVLLGSGIPLFPEIGRQLDLQLVDCKAHKNGCVQVTYQVKNNGL